MSKLLKTPVSIARPGSASLARALAGITGLALAVPLLAQTGATGAPSSTATPSTLQMIEQLKHPRTRSMRNLTVEAVPAPAPAAPGDKPADAASALGSNPPLALAALADPTLGARPSLSLLIQFDFDSARVRPESQQALTNLSQALQSADLAASRFAVEGHTDAKGNAGYNLKLSESRAQAVSDFLKGQGVAPARLLAAGKGAGDLANSAAPFAAENRRVRIVNLD